MRRALGALLLVLVTMPSGVACIRCLTGGCDEATPQEVPEHDAPDCHAAHEPPPCHSESRAENHCSDSRLAVVGADCCATMAGASSWTPALLAKAVDVPSPALPELGDASALSDAWDRRQDRPPAGPPPRTRHAPIYTLHSSLLI